MVIRDPAPGAVERMRPVPATPTTVPISNGSRRRATATSKPRAAGIVGGHTGAGHGRDRHPLYRPLVYGDEILVTARTVRLGRTSFEMEYAVWRDGLCALGRAVLILVVNATGEKTPLPRHCAALC